MTFILTWVGEGKPWWIGEQLCHLRDDLAGELDDQEVDSVLKDHSSEAFEEAREAFFLHLEYRVLGLMMMMMRSPGERLLQLSLGLLKLFPQPLVLLLSSRSLYLYLYF